MESTTSQQRIPGGELLSLGLDEMAEVLGGSGRARMVWAALANGVDPFSAEGEGEYLSGKTAQVLKDTVQALPWKVRFASRVSPRVRVLTI